MPLALDEQLRNVGTRFRLYSQSPVLSAVGEPEPVWVSPAPGTIGPGPSDERMYVVDPLYAKQPYDPLYGPPFFGPTHAPATPGPSGHFDHLLPGTREFRAAHIYASLRRVLDIWQAYLGRPLPWHFSRVHERLEVVSWLDWENAHSGFGFIEAGVQTSESGVFQYYAENFDILAHELGHSILYSEIGIPDPRRLTAEYLGFHEALSDTVCLISAMHFDSLIDRLLDNTRGNLYTLNELNRIAEQSDSEQIRLASNGLRMSDVADAWSEIPEACDEHRLGRPLTGALFDILVDVFLDGVERYALVPHSLAVSARGAPDETLDYADIQRQFDRRYALDPAAFKLSLLEARDYLGTCLALALQFLDEEILGFGELRTAMVLADRELSDGYHRTAIEECFDWRGIPLRSLGRADTAAWQGASRFEANDRNTAWRRQAASRRGS